MRPRAGSGALGGPLVHLDRTTSTNDRARALALAGAPAGSVVLAEEQTEGRGRQGRTWTTPRGCALTFSMLVRRTEPPHGSAQLAPLACAIAVCEACEAVAPVRCEIKWPNDVVVGQRKLAGILLEARPREGWAIVGIGVNVDTTGEELVPELRATATSLRIESGEAASREQLLDALLERLAARLSQRDVAGLLADYRARDSLAGRSIAWTSDGEERVGLATGIDDRGNLVVLAEDGERHALAAGEVHLAGDLAGPSGSASPGPSR